MTDIYLHNTKTRSKERFTPLDPQNVRMYVCGPTVYDRAHLGNARPVLVFDVLYRLLRHVYGQDHVTYVRNFTDVDDKINATALARQQAGAQGSLEALISQRTEETIDWYLKDMGALGALEPDHAPRATAYIAPMIAMIEDLIAKGHAYAKDGHALFRVRSYKDYGKLSGRSVDDMIAGARVEVAPFKEDPMDFVLWKPSTDDQPGWDSPWGRGRPGWHIECSAMAHDLLGEAFDIHGGGNDLMFPHHENEIAQSACAGHGFAKVWMHNEMLQVEGKKMSKSLGNFFTVRDLLEGHGPSEKGVPGEVIRFVMLSTHYRKPMDWTKGKATQAAKDILKMSRLTESVSIEKEKVDKEFIELLANDLNTHGALTYLRKLVKEKNAESVKGCARVLGLKFRPDPSDRARVGKVFDTYVEGMGSKFSANAKKTSKIISDFFQEFKDEIETVWDELPIDRATMVAAKKANVSAVALAYHLARLAKDFRQADLLKAQANEIGYDLLATADGAQWKPMESK